MSTCKYSRWCYLLPRTCHPWQNHPL